MILLRFWQQDNEPFVNSALLTCAKSHVLRSKPCLIQALTTRLVKAMSNRTEILKEIEKIETRVAAKKRSASSHQSFDGTLRIKLEKTYVSKADGNRALKELRTAKLAFSK
jgi:hypothetical protein